LLTGLSSPNGIGFHTALQLAVKGAKVYVGARSVAKAQEAIKEMRTRDSSIGADRLHPFVADLGDLKAVRTAAENLMASTDRLDILINNAGL
jgi:NAD(P)-dependent dehydrogenase (short-subunit alcohol dehydrogenase family)